MERSFVKIYNNELSDSDVEPMYGNLWADNTFTIYAGSIGVVLQIGLVALSLLTV